MKEIKETSPASTADSSANTSPLYKRESFWVILVLLAIFVVGSILSYQAFATVKDLFADALRTPSKNTMYTTKFDDAIPSSCGYSISRPTTANESTGEQWIYEEVPVETASFRGIAPATVLNQGVLMGTILYKTQKEKFNKNADSKEEFSFGQPGIISFCTNNSNKWTLDDFVSYVKKNSNDKLTYTVKGGRSVWGTVPVQQVRVKGIFMGEYVDEPFFLSVIPADSAYSRLVIFQPWGGGDEDIMTDLDSIEASVKPRTVTSALSLLPGSQSSGTQTASCTQYKIYEGQFASDKCYSSGDLNDLKYYISRYNSAVFEQNSNASSMKITCNGSEFFKNSCEEDKKQYDQAVKDQETYKSTILGIIAKGK